MYILWSKFVVISTPRIRLGLEIILGLHCRVTDTSKYLLACAGVYLDLPGRDFMVLKLN